MQPESQAKIKNIYFLTVVLYNGFNSHSIVYCFFVFFFNLNGTLTYWCLMGVLIDITTLKENIIHATLLLLFWRLTVTKLWVKGGGRWWVDIWKVQFDNHNIWDWSIISDIYANFYRTAIRKKREKKSWKTAFHVIDDVTVKLDYFAPVYSLKNTQL